MGTPLVDLSGAHPVQQAPMQQASAQQNFASQSNQAADFLNFGFQNSNQNPGQNQLNGSFAHQ